MRLETTVATIACGLMMMYSGIGCKANEEHNTDKSSRLSTIQETTIGKFKENYFIIKDILKEELDSLDKRDCSDSFKYHLWMIYGMEIGKTDSIEATHKNLKDFYKKHDSANYATANQVFGEIEKKFSKDYSHFVDIANQKRNL